MFGIPELAEYTQRVDRALEAALITDNSSLKQPALRVIQGGGKRLRPCLVIAWATSSGKAVDDTVIQAAVAIELLHIASLVHDDIIDQAATRRGVQTVNVKEGVASAILVGDYLLALALSQAAAVSLETAGIIANTFADMCEGQSQELADTYNPNRTIEAYLITIRNKTAALLAAACQIGGLCAGLTANEVVALRSYGEAFGMAFQLADDLLDFVSTPEMLGKPIGTDIRQGVYTLPILLSLQGPTRRLVHSWLGKKPQSRVSQAAVLKTLLDNNSIQQTHSRAQAYNKLAAKALGILNQNDGVIALANFPIFYLKKALQKTNIKI